MLHIHSCSSLSKKQPETIGDIQKGDVVAWDYSLLVVSSHSSLNSSAIPEPTDNTTDSLLTRAAINLTLSLSDIKTIRIFVDPENIQVSELRVRELSTPHVESFVRVFEEGLYGQVGLIAVSWKCSDDVAGLRDEEWTDYTVSLPFSTLVFLRN